MAFMIAKSILQQHFNTLNDYMDLKDYSCMRSICKVLQQLCPPASSMVKTHLCWGCKPGSDKQCSFAPKHMVASMKLCGCPARLPMPRQQCLSPNSVGTSSAARVYGAGCGRSESQRASMKSKGHLWRGLRKV